PPLRNPPPLKPPPATCAAPPWNPPPPWKPPPPAWPPLANAGDAASATVRQTAAIVPNLVMIVSPDESEREHADVSDVPVVLSYSSQVAIVLQLKPRK